MLGMPCTTRPLVLHICVMSKPASFEMLTPRMGFHTTTFLPSECTLSVMIFRKSG